MIWTWVAVKCAADFTTLIVYSPMRNPDRRKRPVILALRSEAARVSEQIRQSMDSRRQRSRVASESHLDLRL